MKKDFMNALRSVKFWNFLVLVILIITGIFNIDFLVVELVIGSILAMAIIAENEVDNNFWIIFMPSVWFLAAIGGLIIIGMFFYNLVEKFNKYLDR